MGGNALSYVSTRLTKKNYEQLAQDCVERLRALYPGKRIEVLGAYRAKADFGDCDILVEAGGDYDPMQAARALNAVEVVRNGPVTSVGVRVRPEVSELDGNLFQVDLIRMEAQGFDFALNYFGRGDAGNLIGRLFHACGLTLRHDGLYFYVRDGDYKFREILLTRSFDEALRFLDYDPQTYAAGFDTLEDIYRYVASSPYFNPSLFLLENRNAKSRMRNKKRTMYMQFLKFCEAHPGLTVFEYPEDKSAWMPRIEKHFPRFVEEYRRAMDDLAKERAVKAKFNGEWVSRLTGLQGKELGKLMRAFKESFPTPDDMRKFILTSDEATVAARVLQVSAKTT
jgi:hypothetical protein